MMIALVSHHGRCCIGINSDRAAVTEPELLTSSLREGMDEVLALRRPLAAVAGSAKGVDKRRKKSATARAAGRSAASAARRAVRARPKKKAGK
jgi:hypothetical protein